MATTPALVRRPSRIRLVFSPIFGWELGMSVSSAMSGSEPRRGEHGIAVGKGTRLVPAAHGGRSVRLPDPSGVDGAAKIGVICSVDADGREAEQWEKPPLRSQALQASEVALMGHWPELGYAAPLGLKAHPVSGFIPPYLH